LRGFRIVVWSLLLAAIAAASLLLFRRGEHVGSSPQAAVRVATDAEQEAMLAALLDHRPDLFPGRPLPPPEPGDPPRTQRPARPLVVSDKTMALCLRSPPDVAGDPCNPAGALYEPATLETPSGWPVKSTLDALLAANRRAGSFPLPRHLRIVPDSDGDAGRPLTAGWWPAFYARYPDSAGTLAVSRGIIDPEGRHGWIYAATLCEGTCGRGFLITLSSVADGRWQVDRAFMVWIS
jgi:hypothetical protein